MKGVKRDMPIILIVFLKEILLYSEQFGHFGTKMVCALFTLILLSGFFINFTQEKGTQGYVKIFSVFFFKKKSLLGQFYLFKSFFNFWLGVVKRSQATVTIGSLKSQDMISQVNIYVLDSVLRYYVMFMYEGQYST